MTLKENITSKTKEFKNTKFEIKNTTVVPTIDSNGLTFGCTGLRFDAVVLYIDMRHSTELLDEHRRNVVAKLHMAYYNAIVSVAKKAGGECRSFNGDSLLVFFAGTDKATVANAVRCAFRMKYAITEMVNPNMSDYKDINFGIGMDLGTIIATKIGLGREDNTKDLIWLGDAVNKSTRISDECKSPKHVGISAAVYNKLDANLLQYKDEYGFTYDVWSKTWFTYNNKSEYLYSSSCHIAIND